MGKIWNCLTTVIVCLLTLAFFALTVKAVDSRLFCVIVNASIKSGLELDLARYADDLADEGLRAKIIAFEGGTDKDLKAILINEFSNGLVGALFVGNLPSAHFEDIEVEQRFYPCELFFQDMDGIWVDADENGRYENHTGDRMPEIYVGRLQIPQTLAPQEVSLLKKYFERNHAYRTENLSLPDRALLYLDDTWAYLKESISPRISLAYSNQTVVDDKNTTSDEDYLARLKEGWGLVHVIVHGLGDCHLFDFNNTFGYVTSQDIRRIDPRVFFYVLCSCHCANYAMPDYMAGSYVLGSNYGLAAIGMSDAGFLITTKEFYGNFSQCSLGETVSNFFKDSITRENQGLWYNYSYYYGVNLIGDPTLALNPEIPQSETILGDVNGDGTVNIEDLAKIAVVFRKEKGSQGYDPTCDLNNDGTINIVDLTIAACNFGKSIPISSP